MMNKHLNLYNCLLTLFILFSVSRIYELLRPFVSFHWILSSLSVVSVNCSMWFRLPGQCFPTATTLRQFILYLKWSYWYISEWVVSFAIWGQWSSIKIVFSLSPNITQSPQILPPILLHPGYILLFILTITRAEFPLLTIILFNFILLIHFFHFLICQQLPILLISFFP